MYKYVSTFDMFLDDLKEGVKEMGNIFWFAIEQGIHYMFDGGVQNDMVHIFCGGYNLVRSEVPSLMSLLQRKSSSLTECISPK